MLWVVMLFDRVGGCFGNAAHALLVFNVTSKLEEAFLTPASTPAVQTSTYHIFQMGLFWPSFLLCINYLMRPRNTYPNSTLCIVKLLSVQRTPLWCTQLA